MLEELLNIFIGGDNLIMTLLFFALVIVVYSGFVYLFYRFLARKNIIELNLNQYNHYSNPTVIKFFAALFYIIEYIVLLPIVTFFWFGILAIFMLVLSESLSTSMVLVICAALVAAVRVTSYFSENLSQDLAKMVPFSLLSIFITSGIGSFDAASILGRVSEIPSLFNNVPYFLFFIVGVELSMRILGFFASSFKLVKSINAESVATEDMSATE